MLFAVLLLILTATSSFQREQGRETLDIGAIRAASNIIPPFAKPAPPNVRPIAPKARVAEKPAIDDRPVRGNLRTVFPPELDNFIDKLVVANKNRCEFNEDEFEVLKKYVVPSNAANKMCLWSGITGQRLALLDAKGCVRLEATLLGSLLVEHFKDAADIKKYCKNCQPCHLPSGENWIGSIDKKTGKVVKSRLFWALWNIASKTFSSKIDGDASVYFNVSGASNGKLVGDVLQNAEYPQFTSSKMKSLTAYLMADSYSNQILQPRFDCNHPQMKTFLDSVKNDMDGVKPSSWKGPTKCLLSNV